MVHVDAAGLHAAIGDLETLLGNYDAALAAYRPATVTVEGLGDREGLNAVRVHVLVAGHRRGEERLGAGALPGVRRVEEPGRRGRGDVPHRALHLGVGREDLRRYGSPRDHARWRGGFEAV